MFWGTYSRNMSVNLEVVSVVNVSVYSGVVNVVNMSVYSGVVSVEKSVSKLRSGDGYNVVDI